jgi:hypothetical protein
MKITFAHTEAFTYHHCGNPDGTPGEFEFRAPGDYEVPDALGVYLTGKFPQAFTRAGSKAMPGPAANKAVRQPERNR